MRILGKRSLASVLKSLIDVAYYLTILLVILVPAVLLLVTFLRPANVSTEIPVTFQLEPDSYQITPRGEGSAELINTRGALRVTNGPLLFSVESAVLLGVGFVVVMLILRRLRGIFATLKQGNPFVKENVRRIRTIGLLVIALEFVRLGVTIASSIHVQRQFDTTGLRFLTNPDLQTIPILAGVLLLVLAGIFLIGVEMKGDLEAARAIQFQLVPEPLLHRNSVQVQCRMRPANTVGGDYYDMIPLDGDKTLIVVADVAGKGMPAALLMTMLQGSLRTLITADFRGERLLTQLNEYLYRNTPANKMVTMFLGELDTLSGQLRYTNAGHNSGLVMRTSGELETLDSNSIVLGLLPTACFRTDEVTLRPGDRLVVYTDGIVEASNRREQEYGEERLKKFILSHPKTVAAEVVEKLYDDVLRFCQPSQPIDDMTIMLVDRVA